MLGNEMGDFGRHRTLPPFHKRPPVQAAGGVDETVERTSDQSELPERLTSLRNH
jgi:hypothetical protein